MEEIIISHIVEWLLRDFSKDSGTFKKIIKFPYDS